MSVWSDAEVKWTVATKSNEKRMKGSNAGNRCPRANAIRAQWCKDTFTGLQPWQTGGAKRNLRSQWCWSIAPSIYELSLEGLRSKAIAKRLEMKNCSALQTILRWIDKNGDPRKNDDWVKEFGNGY